ncbi:GspE/PulE family protein [Chrysiogenes arsenatis]|uniref:GspE/PulE family protein n=1 Tax=Chrysiogenes arsenatis TaxID=309797 RepID=UPI00041A0777|nr:GspE/PulE family protein [Chrysiogenes arsenatis]
MSQEAHFHIPNTAICAGRNAKGQPIIFVATEEDRHKGEFAAFALREAVDVQVVGYEKLSTFESRILNEAGVGQENVLSAIEEIDDFEEAENLLESSQDDAPVIHWVASAISRALSRGSSDIHIEPYEKFSKLRFRIDGVLHDVATLPKKAHQPVITRIKVLAALNVAESRLPQDGRMRVKMGNNHTDLRISTIPSSFGERVVLRLLEGAGTDLTLEHVGFTGSQKERFQRAIFQPNGIILVTGPTGSGKTTTLYAALRELKSPERNILTIEDPVEYRIEGISQVQVNPKIGLTFANGLRSFLRQDPDVIMVGEIRDLETATVAIQASLTGHLVMATLHTNSSVGVVTRLADMGVEKYLIASTLVASLAQRLVRRLCPHCQVPAQLFGKERELVMSYGLDPELFKESSGCEECMQTGYRGRIGIYELFVPGTEDKSIMSRTDDEATLLQHAVANGLVTLMVDGLQKAAQGITSVKEILRVTSE